MEYKIKLFKRSILGASTIKEAKRAKTPKGAHAIIISIIFKITSFKESKKVFTGLDFSDGIKIIAIPNNIEKNIT